MPEKQEGTSFSQALSPEIKRVATTYYHYGGRDYPESAIRPGGALYHLSKLAGGKEIQKYARTHTDYVPNPEFYAKPAEEQERLLEEYRDKAMTGYQPPPVTPAVATETEAEVGTGDYGEATVGDLLADLGEGFSTGNADFDVVLNQIQSSIQARAAAGDVINPDMELSPQVINELLETVKTEIDPYYARQIDLIKANLQSSIQTLQKQYEIQKEATEEQFKRGIEDIGISAAERGLATSGIREKEEREFALGTAREIRTGALGLESQLRGMYGEAAGQIGTQALRKLPMPGFQAPSIAGLGPGQGRTLEFMPTVKQPGAIPREQATAFDTYRSRLEKSLRKYIT